MTKNSVLLVSRNLAGQQQTGKSNNGHTATADGVQLGNHAALRASDQMSAPPFFSCRPGAAGWAPR